MKEFIFKLGIWEKWWRKKHNPLFIKETSHQFHNEYIHKLSFVSFKKKIE